MRDGEKASIVLTPSCKADEAKMHVIYRRCRLDIVLADEGETPIPPPHITTTGVRDEDPVLGRLERVAGADV